MFNSNSIRIRWAPCSTSNRRFGYWFVGTGEGRWIHSRNVIRSKVLLLYSILIAIWWLIITQMFVSVPLACPYPAQMRNLCFIFMQMYQNVGNTLPLFFLHCNQFVGYIPLYFGRRDIEVNRLADRAQPQPLPHRWSSYNWLTSKAFQSFRISAFNQHLKHLKGRPLKSKEEKKSSQMQAQRNSRLD